jgi:hypothetical protein
MRGLMARLPPVRGGRVYARDFAFSCVARRKMQGAAESVIGIVKVACPAKTLACTAACRGIWTSE